MKRFLCVACLWMTAQLPLAARESKIAVGGGADRIAVVEDRSLALVGVIEEQSLFLLNLTTGAVIGRIPLGFEPLVTVYDPKTGLAYVGGASHDTLAVVDLQQQKIVADIDLKGGVYDLALSSQRGVLVATHPASNRISILDLKTRQTRFLEMPQPALACAIDEATGQILVSLNGGPLGLVLVDGSTGELIARLRSGAVTEDIAMDNSHNRAILLNSGSEDLSIVPLTLAGQYQTIGLDFKPTRFALSPDQRLAYVTSRDNDRLQIVDLDQGRIIATRSLGRQPTGIAVLGDGSYVVMQAGAQNLLWEREANLPPPPLVATSSPKNQSGALSGVVRDLAGRPVGSGTLQVQGRTVPILPDGSFLVPQLPAGRHDVTFKVPGYPELKIPVQARAGYVRTLSDIQLPPQLELGNANGAGFLPDGSLYSDLLARQLMEQAATQLKDRSLTLLNGPLGPAPEFKQFLPLVKNINILDRDSRYTTDLERLKIVGRTLKLRYLVFTQVQSNRGYDSRGNPLLNGALRLLVPFFPLEIPNFTPNQLRTSGLALVIDLKKARIGDKATFWQANAEDNTGGGPLFEEEADGLFRQGIIRIGQSIVKQWQEQTPFKS
ncbi:hypothetical protein [Anthocerotibacter panamensis]|uniref:hypothetical protein n=1 Tax=Anthocerotibacter panamensis TaxID=2857077 RepID=UPI001C402DD5|nr:hypothetical protein [Anthocerotibacter panamensis]